jgi:hypothetical protein
LSLLGVAGLAVLVVKGPLVLPGSRRRITTDESTPALVLDDFDGPDGDEELDRKEETAEPVPAGARHADQTVSSERQS